MGLSSKKWEYLEDKTRKQNTFYFDEIIEMVSAKQSTLPE